MDKPTRGGPTAPGIVWRHDQLVGFGSRFVAIFIDGILISILGAILNFVHLPWLGSIAGAVYLIYFWSTSGQTLGDSAMNIKVARTDGAPLTIGTGVVRYIGFLLSTVVIFLGVLWVLWDPNKQGWHDKIANTVVVRAQ